MKSGLQTLHEIDAAISKARQSVLEASLLPKRTAQALIELRRRQTQSYEKVAKERLKLLEDGEGGKLGYVDRQAEKLLTAHESLLKKQSDRVSKTEAGIAKLESQRRQAELDVSTAIDNYDKAVAQAEKIVLKDMAYMAALTRVEKAETTLSRASEKLELAEQEQITKSAPYKKDPFFTYLKNRKYGSKQAKGWFLTKWLDNWVASLVDYQNHAENFSRLEAIPKRLANHVRDLEDAVLDAREDLENIESEILEREGVKKLHKASMSAQKKLEAIDNRMDKAEAQYAELRESHQKQIDGQDGPYAEAIALIAEALKRMKFSDLSRLAATTTSLEDDRAIEDIRDLADTADDLEDDQKEAKDLLRKYEKNLRELEEIRRQFKSRRYDSPASIFEGDLVGALLMQVLAGALDGKNLWRQIERAQRTVKRYSDYDFGGVDWTDGLRLPRSPSTRRSSRGSRSPRIRTSIPRMPRTRLPKTPKIVRSIGRKKGGFKTIGRF